MASESSKTSIESSPPEIIVQYFAKITDFATLDSFSKSTPRVREVFKAHESQICKSFITRTIEPELFPIFVKILTAQQESIGLQNAISAYKGAPGNIDLYIAYTECAVDFCEAHLAVEPVAQEGPKLHYTLESIREVLGLRAAISNFANAFIQSIQGDLALAQAGPITAKETFWISKAFCILELVRLVIPFRAPGGSQDLVFAKFWRCFSPWEASQMLLMYRFLMDLTKTACDIHAETNRVLDYVGLGQEPSDRARFVLNEGLVKLQPLHAGGRLTDDHARVLKGYESMRYGTYREFIYFGYYKLWLCRPGDEASGVSYNMPDVIEKYKESDEDTGPRDAWFFGLFGLSSSLDFTFRRYFDWRNGPLGYFASTRKCLFFRERMDNMSPGLLPTMEEMIEATRNIYMDSDGIDHRIGEESE